MEEEGKNKRQFENQYLKKEHSKICDPLIFGISYEEMITSSSFFFKMLAPYNITYSWVHKAEMHMGGVMNDLSKPMLHNLQVMNCFPSSPQLLLDQYFCW